MFTTETREQKREIVTAFERGSGKELWRTEWEGTVRVPFFAKSNGDWIRATPACDGESPFVAGMRDVLVCLDAQTQGAMALRLRGKPGNARAGFSGSFVRHWWKTKRFTCRRARVL